MDNPPPPATEILLGGVSEKGVGTVVRSGIVIEGERVTADKSNIDM